MTADPHPTPEEAPERLARRLETREPFKHPLQIAAELPVRLAGAEEDSFLGDVVIVLGQGDYPCFDHIADETRRLQNEAAAMIRALAAETATLRGERDEARAAVNLAKGLDWDFEAPLSERDTRRALASAENVVRLLGFYLNATDGAEMRDCARAARIHTGLMVKALGFRVALDERGSEALVARLDLLGAMPADESARGRIGSYIEVCREAAAALRSVPSAATPSPDRERAGAEAREEALREAEEAFTRSADAAITLCRNLRMSPEAIEALKAMRGDGAATIRALRHPEAGTGEASHG